MITSKRQLCNGSCPGCDLTGVVSLQTWVLDGGLEEECVYDCGACGWRREFERLTGRGEWARATGVETGRASR